MDRESKSPAAWRSELSRVSISSTCLEKGNDRTFQNPHWLQRRANNPLTRSPSRMASFAALKYSCKPSLDPCRTSARQGFCFQGCLAQFLGEGLAHHLFALLPESFCVLWVE